MQTGTTRITLSGEPRDYLDYRKGSGNTVEIYDIAVNSERGVGKGRRLVETLLEIVQRDESIPKPAVVYAITRRSNRNAREFYSRVGFRQKGDLINFYIDGGDVEDGILYGVEVR